MERNYSRNNNRQVELELGFNTGPPQRIDGGNNSIWETWGHSSVKRKAVRLAKRRSTPDIAYFSAFATPLGLSVSCYPSLSVQAIVLTGKLYRPEISVYFRSNVQWYYQAHFEIVGLYSKLQYCCISVCVHPINRSGLNLMINNPPRKQKNAVAYPVRGLPDRRGKMTL